MQKGAGRIPGSGKILWGMGLISVLRGNTAQAAERFERAVELLPEWVGSYSTLGVFYYQTGRIEKAREVLDRFKGSNAGGLNVELYRRSFIEGSCEYLSCGPANLYGRPPATSANGPDYPLTAACQQLKKTSCNAKM